MPGIFYEPVNRRAFLKVSALAGAALGLTGCVSGHKVAADRPKPLHLGLLSDIHIPADRVNGHRGFNPWENLKRVIPEVTAVQPEAVIVNGDVARLEGLVPDYNEAHELLRPVAAIAPVYLSLGNHDDRANFSKVFTPPARLRAKVADKHVLVLEEEVARFVILDSLLYTNKVAGLLGKSQRAWLAEFLATNTEKPVVIFVHHTLGDGDGDLLDSSRLFEMLRPHPQVKAIFYGHSHEWSIKEHERLKLINLPAVGYNFADKEPVGWVDARFDPEGVNLTLRAFAGNTRDNLKIQRVRWA